MIGKGMSILKRTLIHTSSLCLLALLISALLFFGIIPGAYASGGGSSSIVFDANGGSGWMNALYLYDDTWTVPDSDFTNPGHAFVGWGLTRRGPVTYRPGDLAYNDGDMTLYAHWTAMTEAQLQAMYAPKAYELWRTSTERLEGVTYARAQIRFGLKSSLASDEGLTATLRLGAADGPVLPGTQTIPHEDITSYSTSNNYAWVSVPFLEDGVSQVVADGAVNGLLSGQKVFVTLAREVGGAECESNPVVFSCTKPEINDDSDEVAWFAESGNGTVVYNDYSATITLTQDTVLPSGGLTLGYNSYHIAMNGHTLTGTLYTAMGEVFIEHETEDGTVLAAYTNNRQKLTFNGYGYTAQLTGSVTVKMTNWGSFVCDSTYMPATVTNGTRLAQSNYTAQTLQDWGYVNAQNPDEYEVAELSADALAGYTPKNVTVTPVEDGLVVECDYEPEARVININVDVIFNDGTSARLKNIGTPSSKDQVMSLEGDRQPFFVSVRRLSDEEEQEITENGEQKYVNGFRGGQRISVTMNFEIGPHMQETPWSAPPVTFVYSASVIGRTFGQYGEVERLFLPNIATLTVNSPLEVTYLGEPVFMDYTLTLADGTPLVPGVDYTEEYINNGKPGEATLALIGLNNYSGRMTQPFTIAPVDLAGEAVEVTLAFTSAVYDGSSHTPVIVVTCDGWTLSKSRDYYVAYSDNVASGQASITLTPGYSNVCVGERTEHFTIEPRSLATGPVEVRLSQNRFIWTGEACTPGVTAKWGETELVEDTDYTLTYEGNVNAGTAWAVLTGMGNYKDVRRVAFTIFNPAALAASATIDPIPPQIYTGKALEPKVTVRDGSKILTPGWDYSVAYSSNVNAGTGTVTVTGRRDYTGEITASFIIDPADLGLLAAQGRLTMTLSKAEYPYGDAVYAYSGGANKPTATLTLTDDDDYDWNNPTLYEGTSFTLSYENNIEAGTATAIATGMGNYGGSCAAEFTITPLSLSDVYSASVSTVVYNGLAQTPAISMYTTYLDQNDRQRDYCLAEGVDYTVTGWANNVSAGTATVTVVGAGNNFTGTRAIDFTINPMPLSKSDFDCSAIAVATGEDDVTLSNLTLTWRQNGINLVEGRDFTVENLSSSGDYAYFYLRGMGSFGSSTGTMEIPLSSGIGQLPASGSSGINTEWEIDGNGVMTITGSGTLSRLDAWRAYAGLVKRIVVQDYDSASHFLYISAGAFSDFTNATECTLPAYVTKVDPDAFPKNNRMTVHLPDGVTEINTSYSSNFEFVRALVNRGSTTEATIRNGSYSYFGYEGYPDFQLYDTHSEERGLMLAKYSGNGGTVTIPDFVDSIEAYGFERYGITKVVIPGTVKRMNAFLENCCDLRELVIQPGSLLTELPNQFISGCDNITIHIPDNITTIGVLNYYSYSDMLIVANCDSYAIEWAKSRSWTEESVRDYGPRYRMLHRNPMVHPGQAPTCEAAGWTEYVTCTACSCNTKTDLPATGHSWNGTTYVWNNDHTSVTATRACRHGDHPQTETVSATATVVPATCAVMGSTTYTSNVFTNPDFRVQTVTEAIPLAAHTPVHEASRAATHRKDGVRGGTYCSVCDADLQNGATVSHGKVLWIPAAMKTIDEQAFMNVAAEQITLPAGATYIGDKAFANCDDLALVVIPGSVTTISGNPFQGSDVAVICPEGSVAAVWCDGHGIPHNP